MLLCKFSLYMILMQFLHKKQVENLVYFWKCTQDCEVFFKWFYEKTQIAQSWKLKKRKKNCLYEQPFGFISLKAVCDKRQTFISTSSDRDIKTSFGTSTSSSTGSRNTRWLNVTLHLQNNWNESNISWEKLRYIYP